MEQANKVYAILYNAYESDDIVTGSDEIIFCSLSENKRDEEFDRILNEENKRYDNYKGENDYFDNGNERIDFTIGKWCYSYYKEEYELNKNLLWNRR